ncbi:hypothetical protein CPB85DRAFT_1539624, partial [Mucidula mucida]
MYWGWQGFAFAGIWCLGHEAGHDALSPYRIVNGVVVRFCTLSWGLRILRGVQHIGRITKERTIWIATKLICHQRGKTSSFLMARLLF